MMGEFIKIVGVGCVTALTALLLKSTKPELSFVVTIVGVLIILLWLVGLFQNTANIFYSIAMMAGVNNSLLKLLLKIVGVSYLTEFSAGILNDFGSANVADKISLCGKILIFVLSLPIMECLLQLLQEFLSLL